MRCANGCKSVGLAMMLVVSLGLANVASSEPASLKAAEPVYAVTYAIADLPVWRSAGSAMPQFDPALLVALIKKSVLPQSWQADVAISVYPQNLSLVVTQTEAGHQELTSFLESLRKRSER
jgi:hypothetical protein